MSEHAGESAYHDHRKAYLAVFGALIIGTILTVAVAQVNLGKMANIAIGVVIACVKASLVALIFMHLKDEERSFFAIAIIPLVLFVLLMVMLMPDVGLTEAGPLDDPSSPHYRPPAAAKPH